MSDRILVGGTSELPNASGDPLKSNFRLRVFVQEGEGPFAGRLFARIFSAHDFHYRAGTETHHTSSLSATAAQCRELAGLLVLAADYIEGADAPKEG